MASDFQAKVLQSPLSARSQKPPEVAPPAAGSVIEADWKLLYTCNFRCAYCFFDTAMLARKIRRHASVEQWRDAFRAAGRPWLLHLTGGEPTLHPDFCTLCRALTEDNEISLNTNLSSVSIEEFACTVPADRVRFINASLHPEMRAARGDLDALVRRAHLLQDNGFNIMLTVVLTPDVISRFADLRADLRAFGLEPVPKLLNGAFAGLDWPAAYSAAQRASIVAAYDAARPEIARVRAAAGGSLSIDPELDLRFLAATPLGGPDGGSADAARSPYSGLDCAAGRDFVSIEPDGSVMRCSPRTALGNLLAGTLLLLPAPLPCDTSYCQYFCEKYCQGRDLRRERR